MNTKRAGPINGNPLCGLCERVCIEVNRVFDGCIFRLDDQQFTLPVVDNGAPQPWTFISARSSGDTIVTNMNITFIEDTRSRVSFDATIPLSIIFSDADGAINETTASITIHRDMILNLPDESIIPFQIKVSTSLVSSIGTFNGTILTMRCCLIQITKVVAPVDILVPSYGYAEYPECEGNACEAFNSLPLFPPPFG